MRQLSIAKLCDFCWHEDSGSIEAVDTYTVGIALGEKIMPPSTVDVCEAHGQELETLAYVIKTMGAPLDPERIKEQAEQATKRDCPLCQRKMKTTSLTMHLKAVHKVPEVTQPKRCPDCGHKYELGKAMNQHRVMSHGYNIHQDMISRLKSKQVHKGKENT